MLDTLDAPAVRRWSVLAAGSLASHQREIDDLNVFPVPDGDTGTNLALTLRAAADTLAGDQASTASGALRAMARGAVLGARGNSGVIVSQILRGLGEAVDGDVCDARALRRGLHTAAQRAYAAVAEPVEGTILSVARAAADAARSAGSGLATVLRAAVGAASEAVARTPEQLPALAKAGVVDAGGRGLLVLLDALAVVVTGSPSTLAAPRRAPRPRSLLEAAREEGSDDYAYEVQYLLRAEQSQVATLRAGLASLGDSLAVVGTGDGLWNVHVHVNDVGAALEAGVEVGRPYRITVVHFADQIRNEQIRAERPRAEQVYPEQVGPDRAAAPVPAETAVVAVAPGEGLAHLFGGEGVHVVEGGPSANPSSGEVLCAIRASGAAQVVLLPNASQVDGVAEAAAELARAEGIEVAVVPTRSPVQGLAAVAVHDPARRFGDDVVAMAEAAAATRWAEVTVAAHEALTTIGRCQPGDVLGLIDGDVVEIGSAVGAVAVALVDRLLGVGGELITVLVGADSDGVDVPALQAHIAAVAPFVEVAVFDGGQPNYPVLIGVE